MWIKFFRQKNMSLEDIEMCIEDLVGRNAEIYLKLKGKDIYDIHNN